MSYRQELKQATTFDECQQAYDRECENKYKRLAKKHGDSEAFTIMIAQDYSVWSKAQARVDELFPSSSKSFDFSDMIQSRY